MLALLIALLLPSPPPTGLTVEPIAPDTWVATDHDFHASRVLVARMPDATAVIVSSPFEDVNATRLLTWIRTHLEPARIVAINTHFHFDGTGGNAAFERAGVMTWSSDRTRDLVLAQGQRLKRLVWKGLTDPALRARMERFEPRPARQIFPFADGKTFDFGGERVVVAFPGEAHSSDNMVVWFPRRAILFGGCMIKPGDSLGYLGAANLKTWPAAVRALQRYGARIVVAGHARWGGPELLDRTLANAIAASPEVKAARAACRDEANWQACLRLVASGAPDGKPLMAGHWRRLCKPGEGLACDQLALYTDDAAERLKVQGWACEAGNGNACYALSMGLWTADPDRASASRERACALGHPDACEETTLLGGIEARRQAAEPLCAQGDPAGCHALGVALRQRYEGTGKADWAAARAAFETGCAKGHAASCGELGLLHFKGRGVPRGKAIAVEFYRKACAGDDPQGCDELGSAYRFGDGVSTDEAKAYGFVSKACRLGNVIACSSQGDMLTAGDGVRADPVAGAALRLDACRRGIDEACEVLIKAVIAETAAPARAAADALAERAAHDVAVRFNLRYSVAALQKRCDDGARIACALKTHLLAAVRAAKASKQ